MHNAIQIANYFLEKGQAQGVEMTPMKLIKLLYIAHGWMLGLCDKRLIQEDVEAWQYGPVIPELYRAVKSYKNKPITKLLEGGIANLSPEEKHIVDQTFDKYKGFNGIDLSKMAHVKGTPWHAVWQKSEWGIIPISIIQDYYKQLAASA